MPAVDDDFQLQSYQDDLTTDDNASDPVMDEEGDDPAEELGIPRSAFKEELDKEDVDALDDDAYPSSDDEREYIEDADEDGDDDTEY